jgi:3-hydroxyacyl-CoA dehydrogenase/enoyl-CoA hydratase/3-hydroxybutyryl-CoA epimerase
MTEEGPRSSWRWDRTTEGVSTLWFDCPQRSHNVLDRVAFDGLDGCLAEIASDSSVAGVLVRSAKPAGFCAGADLKTFLSCASVAELETFLGRGREVLDRLSRLKVPTVAVVHGVCLGGGLELALACRFRVALASNVPLQIGSPEIQLGLLPAWGAITRLARLLAPRDVLNLLLTGNPIGFLQAKSQGLVDRLVSQDEATRITETLARAANPQRECDREAWRQAIEFAQAQADDQPADFPEVQAMIMDIIEIVLERGEAAAALAAVAQCARLAFREPTLQAITDFFNRRRPSS